MTISSEVRKAGPFTGNGVTTSFPFTFKVFAKSDLEVVRTMPSGLEKTLVLNSDYSVTLNGDQDANPGGTITYPVSGTPLPTGWRLTAIGTLDNIQPTDITNGGGFYPQVIENALDRVTMLIQQLEEELGRTIRIAVSDDVTDGLDLPATSARADKVLGFDSEGSFRLYDTSVSVTATLYRKFTPTAGQTEFTLPQAYTPGANSLYVWMNGAKLISGVDFTETSTTSFTLTSGAAGTDVIEALAGVPQADLPSTDAGLVRYTPEGAGAVARTAQAKMRDIVSRDDFDTLANMWASSSFKPKIDPNTGKVWFNTDTSPLDYSTTKAGAVWQWKDAQNGAANELIPGAVFQFKSTGNGVVNSGTELSQTIWQGQFNFMRKAGDGSAHAFTSIGELEAFGPGGYNELGLFQGEATNKGSTLGTMSGVEMLLKDSPDGGTTTYSTKMQAVVGRIAKYNPTTRKSYNFYASSEGKEPPNGVLGVNPNGYKTWQRGFDFEGANFTSGQFGLAPNNTYLAWLTAAGAAKPIIGISTSNNTVIAAADTTNKIQITNSALASRLEVDNANGDAVLIWVGGALKRVGQGAADSAGTGYRVLIVVN